LSATQVSGKKSAASNWTPGGKHDEIVADSNEGYTSKASCLHGIEVVKQIAASAPINDLT